VEEKFNVRFSPEEMEQMRGVRQIVGLLKAKV